MKWKWILPLAAAFVLQAAGAQELRVVSFEEKTDDIRGRTREKKDLNGDPCALICVELPMPEVQFDGWVIEQQALPGEYLVYVPEGTKKLIIRQGSITPFVYQFDQKLIGKHTYRLRLQLQSGNLSFIRIRCNVKDATLSVQNQDYKSSNGVFDFQLPPGNYSFSVKATDADFSPYEGSLEVQGAPFIEKDITLSTNVMHTLSVVSEKGARIRVDGAEQPGDGSLTMSLPAGLHEVEAVMDDWTVQATADLTRTDAAVKLSFRTPVRMAYPQNATFVIVPSAGALKPAKSSIKSGEVAYLLGDYVIRVEKKNYQPGDKPFSVAAGGSEVEFRMDALVSKADQLFEGVGMAAPDYKKAVKEYEKLAKTGDDRAQYSLGICYLDGLGTQPDALKGRSLLTQSAQQGNMNAALALAQRFGGGDAVEMYRTAASLGSKEASSWLWKHYIENKDYNNAIPYLRELTALNDEEACSAFGDLYFGGLGVDTDYVLAKQYYTIAASLYDNAHSKERLADCKYFGFGEEQDKEGATMDYLRLGDAISRDAAEKVALHYFLTKKDLESANPYFKLAGFQLSGRSDQGSIFYQMGKYMYEKSLFEDAFSYLSKALQNGYSSINLYYALGVLYSNGRGVERDYEKSADAFEKAYRLGDAKSAARLGRLYEQGRGRPKNLNKALSLYQEASRKGVPEAYLYIGTLYSQNNGIGKDLQKSESNWIKAAELGNIEAVKNLVKLYRSQGSIEQASKWEKKL